MTDSILGTVEMEKLWERNFALSRSSQVNTANTVNNLYVAIQHATGNDITIVERT